MLHVPAKTTSVFNVRPASTHRSLPFDTQSIAFSMMYTLFSFYRQHTMLRDCTFSMIVYLVKTVGALLTKCNNSNRNVVVIHLFGWRKKTALRAHAVQTIKWITSAVFYYITQYNPLHYALARGFSHAYVSAIYCCFDSNSPIQDIIHGAHCCLKWNGNKQKKLAKKKKEAFKIADLM